MRLVLGMTLGIVGMIPNLLDLTWTQTIPYIAVGSLVAIALVSVVVLTLIREHFTRRAWAEVGPSIFILVLVTVLCVPLWVTVGVWGAWSGDVLVVGFVVYYLLELRGVVKTHPVWYAGLAIGGILVFISLAMADVEAAASNRQITNAGQAMIWAAAQVFRSTALVDVKPITGPGEVLGFIVILTGVFFAAVLFSAGTAWAVRQGAHRDQEASPDREVRDEVLAALREAGVLSDSSGSAPPQPRWLVDVDWIAGNRRGALWNSREELNAEVLTLLDGHSGELDGRQIVAVVLGRAAAGDGDRAFQSLQVDRTDDIASYLRTHLHDGDVVVSSRPHLVEELADEIVEVQAPAAFLGRLAGAQQTTA